MELGMLNQPRHSVALGTERSSTPRSAAAFTEELHDDEAGWPLVDSSHDSLDQRDRCTNSKQEPTGLVWRRRYKFKSWKVGVSTACLMTTTVLLTNGILTIWASLHFGYDQGSGVGTAYDGDCDVVATRSLWLHIAINALSSILLSASNYTMQCATGPTRMECDQAHARGDWLDVGVLSVRNLRRIGSRRLFIWCLLALSSTPIHLLYNSAVFKTTDDNDYSAVIAGSGFLDVSYNLTKTDVWSKEMHDTYLADPSSWANLTRRQCVQTYTTNALSGRSDVIAIFKNESDARAQIVKIRSTDGKGDEPYDWICNATESRRTQEREHGSGCDGMSQARTHVELWILDNKEVDYCMSKIVPQHCKLMFSVHVLIAVIICNAVKSLAMIWLVWTQREVTFVTFGDALSSWLTEPDMATQDGPSTHMRIPEHKRKIRNIESPRPLDATCMSAISVRRWASALIICFSAVVSSSLCLGLGVSTLSETSDDNILSAGFGTVNTNMVFRRSEDLATSVIVTNTPQLIWSFVYLLYNSLLTNMHLTHELSAYKVHRESLRVTTPCGQQRKSYWLQLPFTYSIPLVVTSALVHWLISQAVFLVHIEGSESQSYMSPAPMLVILVITLCMMLLAIGLGFRKLPGGPMPVAASCSFALAAAAAHRPASDVDAAVLPVKWGKVVVVGENAGHCCFTSQEVEEVISASENVIGSSERSANDRRRLVRGSRLKATLG